VSLLWRERRLAPALSILDCSDDVLWHRDGRATLLYRLQGLHEPGLADEELNATAFAAENVVSALPEETTYQFYVLVDHPRGQRLVAEALPPLPGAEASLLEELRQGRVRELTRVEAGPSGFSFVQERRHVLAATLHPQAFLQSRLLDRLWGALHSLTGRLDTQTDERRARLVTALREATTFDQRVRAALLQLGLGFERMRTGEIVAFVYELLNPSAGGNRVLLELPKPCIGEETSLGEPSFLPEGSPIDALLDEDLVVRREFLRIGPYFSGVITLKQLPDTTEPALLVPLLRLPRARYSIAYRIDVPKTRAELAALRAKATLAAGLRLENFLVKSDRSDPVARAVEKQTDEALERVIASSQRVLGTSLSIVLHEETPAALEGALEDTLAVLARAHGLRGYRETYLLKRAWLSTLPGAPVLVERRRKALSPNAVDMLPVFDFRVGAGKVPFGTPNNSIVLYDPFDARSQANANILVTGTSGAGKSVLVQFLLSGYEMACAGRGEPRPYVVVLDNGASYKRYIDLRPEDGRYVAFDFDDPPGVDVFAWDEASGPIDEHVSRLEWLFLDLLRVPEAESELFERRRASLERALYAIYERGGRPGFPALVEALSASEDARALALGLFPFAEGTFSRLFRNPPSSGDSPRVCCYDFKGLAEHPDLASIALRLAIFEVRRFASRMNRKGHRTFLVLDESWALLESRGRLAETAAPFVAASVRMGRKEGTSVIGLSQQIEDFAHSSYGAAILGNSATKFVGLLGTESLEGVRTHLRLKERQLEEVRRLRRTACFHEFLLVQGETSQVVRVPLDPLSRWIFTTSPQDKETLEELGRRRPDLTLRERLRLLAAEG
jgi:hypothetical protein